MATPDLQWLQLPAWNQVGEINFEEYEPQAGSLRESNYDGGENHSMLLSSPSTPDEARPPRSRKPRQQREDAISTLSESDTAGSTSQIGTSTNREHISQRRRSQNRNSQRAFRQRRAEKFHDLQARVAGLEKQLAAAKMMNRLLSQLSGLRSLDDLRVKLEVDGSGIIEGPGAILDETMASRERGALRRVESEVQSPGDGLDLEPPACDEYACFQTSDLPLLGPPLGGLENLNYGSYWSLPAIEYTGFEADMTGWQGIGNGSPSSTSRSGGIRGTEWP